MTLKRLFLLLALPLITMAPQPAAASASPSPTVAADVTIDWQPSQQPPPVELALVLLGAEVSGSLFVPSAHATASAKPSGRHHAMRYKLT